MTTSRLAALALLLLMTSLPISADAQPTSAALVPTGLAEIDAMRRDAAVQPTTAANAAPRQSLVFSWVRLLVHRGVDLVDFHVACAEISAWGTITAERYAALDRAIATLNRIQAAPRFIEEVRGVAHTQPTTQTDWPVFQGNRELTGLSPDRGPATGEIAWRFPVGLSWYAAPAVEDGRVYIASPGITTLAYCLDEATGKLIWTTRQNGLQVYSTPRASSTPVVLPDRIVLRATSGSWEHTEKVGHVMFLDKRTGALVQELDANRVDYRRGVAPVQGNRDYLVYPWSRLDLRSMPAVVQMQDTVVVRRADGRPWWTLRVGAMFAEPLLTEKLVLAGTDAGVLHGLHLAGPQRIAWRYEAGAPIRATPAVEGDAVYLGTEDGTLHAVELATGKLRWKHRANAGEARAAQLFSRPRVHAGRVYLGSATREVYCYDAVSGRQLWKTKTSDWIRSRPLVLGERVLVAGLDGRVTALDLDGQVAWSAAAGRHPILADLAGSERGVLVSSSDLFLHSLAVADGHLQWRHSLLECIYEKEHRIFADVVAGGGDFQSPPTVSGGTVFVGGADRFVRAIDPASGRERWRFETTGQVSGAVAIQDGRVFFGQQGGDRKLHCVSAADGAPLWTSDVGWVWTSCMPDGERVFAGTVEGDIFAVAAADGKLLWKRSTNGGVYPAPAVRGSRVYTGSWDGYYYALNKETGAIDWSYATEGRDYAQGGGPDSAAAILWKGKLISRVVPQTLIALDAESGQPAWRFQDKTRVRPRHTMNATASASGDRIFVSSSIDHDGMPCGGRLFCLDDATGKPLWHYTGAGGWTGSSCTPEMVICGSSTEVFVTALAIEPAVDGSPRVQWRTRVTGVFQESIPAIYGSRAFLLCSDGYLYAFQ